MKRNYWNYLHILSLLLIAYLGYRQYAGTDKTVRVVDIIRLFNGYRLKMDMEAADSVMLTRKVRELDSVRALIELQKTSLPENEYRHYLRELDMEYERVHMASNDRINEAVWQQLNRLIKQYGKEHGIRVLVGANGMGSVMYYDEGYDITDKVIEYVNKDYNKK